MIAPSLADPEGASPLVAAVQWLEAVALGTIATSIALIAVASIGFLMLSGRLPIRRGATVIAGCFILFGAPIIAASILSLARTNTQASSTFEPAQPSKIPPVPTAKSGSGYDPYAGAAVPQR